MEIANSIRNITQDPAWVRKSLWGALFILLGVTIPIAIGYALLYIRNVVEGRDSQLPEWEEFGQLWISGLVLIVMGLLWMLPGAMLNRIPCAGPIIGILWSVLTTLAFGYIAVRFSMTQTFSAAFEFGDIFTYIQGNLGNVLMAMLMNVIFFFVASFGVIALVVGLGWTLFLALLAGGNLLAQAWRLYYQVSPGEGEFLPPTPPAI